MEVECTSKLIADFIVYNVQGIFYLGCSFLMAYLYQAKSLIERQYGYPIGIGLNHDPICQQKNCATLDLYTYA